MEYIVTKLFAPRKEKNPLNERFWKEIWLVWTSLQTIHFVEFWGSILRDEMKHLGMPLIQSASMIFCFGIWWLSLLLILQWRWQFLSLFYNFMKLHWPTTWDSGDSQRVQSTYLLLVVDFCGHTIWNCEWNPKISRQSSSEAEFCFFIIACEANFLPYFEVLGFKLLRYCSSLVSLL